MTVCEIDFENYVTGAIYSGQMLRGTVRLILPSQKSVRGVYVQICGEAFAEWTPKTQKTAIAAQNVHLNEKQHFVDGNGGRVELLPGTYKYNFQCMLPPDLPSSIEGKIGSIRYFVRVIIDNTMWVNEVFKKSLNIIKPLDLNDDPIYRKSLSIEKDKSFFPYGLFCCYPSSPLNILVRTQVRGFIPGQIINLQIIVNNRSNHPVFEFKVLLYKHIFYFVRAESPKGVHQRTEVVLVSKQTAPGCNAHRHEAIHVNMKVPSICPTDLSSSKIIKLKYFIRVMGLVGDWHENPLIEFPITIGTHPIEHLSSSSTSLSNNKVKQTQV